MSTEAQADSAAAAAIAAATRPGSALISNFMRLSLTRFLTGQAGAIFFRRWTNTVKEIVM
jgi:hypothetical protein